MKSYLGYLLSNLLFTLLIVYCLEGINRADDLTIFLALVSVGSGITQSLVGSVMLHISEGVKENSAFRLNLKLLVGGLFFGGACSLLTYFIIGWFLFLLSNTLFEYSVLAHVDDEIYFFLLAFISGALAFVQTYMQRLGKINIFYNQFTISTIIVVLIVWGAMALSLKVGLVLASAFFSTRAGLNLFLSIVSVVRNEKNTDFSDVILPIKVRSLFSLYVSGCVAKLNAPFDRAILMGVGEGYATIYHFVLIFIGAVGRYFDVNVIYRYYIRRRNRFSYYREKAFLYVLPVFLIWLLFYPLIGLYVEGWEVPGLRHFENEVIFLVYGTILSVYMAIPMLISSLGNTLYVLYFYENGMNIYIARVSIVSSLIAFLLKSFVVKYNYQLLVPLILNIQFVIMILVMRSGYCKREIDTRAC